MWSPKVSLPTLMTLIVGLVRIWFPVVTYVKGIPLLHKLSCNFEVEKTWISLIGWTLRTSIPYPVFMKYRQFSKKWRKTNYIFPENHSICKIVSKHNILLILSSPGGRSRIYYHNFEPHMYVSIWPRYSIGSCKGG